MVLHSKYVTYYYLSALLIFVSTNIYGQTEKGKWLVGNSIGLMSIGYASTSFSVANISLASSSEAFRIGFSPNVGYFILDNMSISIRGNYSYQSYAPRGVGLKVKSVMIGPRINYFIKLNSKLSLYFTASGLFGSNIVYVQNIEQKGGIQSYIFSTGLAYFLSDNVSINTEVFYNTSRLNGNLQVSSNNLLGIDLGVNFFF